MNSYISNLFSIFYFFLDIVRLLLKIMNECSGMLRVVLRSMTAPIPRIKFLLVKIPEIMKHTLYDLVKF